MQSLKDRLAPIVAKYEAPNGEHYRRLVAFIDSIGQLERRLQPGAMAPDFLLPGQDGQLVRLTDLIRTGPLALVFIRGMWCPYCVEQVRALRDAAGLFGAEGINLVVLTPEIGGHAEALAKEHELPFPVLCDVDSGVALSYGCLFPVPPADRAFLISKDIDLAERYGSDAWFLPLASTFVIGSDSRIQAIFGAADFTTRPEPADVLASGIAASAGTKD